MTDVFVIGGGPAGLAAAIAAAARGLSVVVADAGQPPIDKACGECLLPEGVAAARKLGLNLGPNDCFAIRGIRFIDGKTSFAAEFRNGPGLGIRRTVLHAALARLAEVNGVEFRWGCSVPSPVEARWIIGADGGASRVRASVGRITREHRRFGFRVHYRVAPWTDFVEIHWADGCQMYLTPVAPDEVGVAVLSRDPKLRVADALARFPAVRARLAGVRECSRERGGLTATRVLNCVTRGNRALIGDASGSVDAITADGLSLSFQQALLLADALERGDLAHYEATHRRLASRPRLMANVLLLADRFATVRRPVFGILAARPKLFEGMLAVHTGALRSTS